MEQKFKLGDNVIVSFKATIVEIRMAGNEIRYKVDGFGEPLATNLKEGDITLAEA